jgi:hypothetical protein
VCFHNSKSNILMLPVNFIITFFFCCRCCYSLCTVSSFWHSFTFISEGKILSTLPSRWKIFTETEENEVKSVYYSIIERKRGERGTQTQLPECVYELFIKSHQLLIILWTLFRILGGLMRHRITVVGENKSMKGRSGRLHHLRLFILPHPRD